MTSITSKELMTLRGLLKVFNRPARLKFFVFCFLTTFFLSGVSAANEIKDFLPTLEVVNIPPSGVEVEMEIGQSLISKGYIGYYPTIVIGNNISQFTKSTSMNRFDVTTKFNAGRLLKHKTGPLGTYYKAEGATYTFAGGFLAPSFVQPCDCGILVPANPILPAIVYTFHTSGNNGYEYGAIPVKFTEGPPNEIWTTGSFKKELIYNGVSQKTASVTYREFSNDYARPSFSLDLKYDLSEDDVIGFRGARLQIIKAGNVAVRYKVLKPLD
jgi:hypothetical protein